MQRSKRSLAEIGRGWYRWRFLVWLGRETSNMAYWITTHYPHRRPDNLPWHVYLRDPFEAIAMEFRKGDRVLFFELKYQRALATGSRFPVGRRGIVRVARISNGYQVRPASQAVATYKD